MTAPRHSAGALLRVRHWQVVARYKTPPDLRVSAPYTSRVEAREGLAQVMRRVGASVYPVANGSTEDVVQEACARAIKSGVSLEAEQWLRTVAKRVAIDQYRRRRETPSGGAADLERWSTEGDGDPEDAVIRSERQAAVREALATLPPRYRKALLAYAEEDSAAAVANRLGMSAAATWTLLSRARSRLKLQLEQAGFVPALFAGGDRPRLRHLLAAGAVAATATTAAIVPALQTPDVPRPAEPAIVGVATAADSAPDDVRDDTDALPLDVEVAPPDVTGSVTDAVDELEAEAVNLTVAPCVGPDDTRLGVELTVVPDERPRLAQLVGSVPEPLRDPLGQLTC